jgi:hypothetical protein
LKLEARLQEIEVLITVTKWNSTENYVTEKYTRMLPILIVTWPVNQDRSWVPTKFCWRLFHRIEASVYANLLHNSKKMNSIFFC